MGIYNIPDGIVQDLRSEKNLVVVGDANLKGAASIGDASGDVLKFFGIGSGTSQSTIIANSATVIETNTARINSIVALLAGYGLTATS